MDMEKTVTARQILNYIKVDWKIAHHLIEVLGGDDERAKDRALWCIGMKEMAEALLHMPINLKLDGRVTIGLDDEIDVDNIEE